MTAMDVSGKWLRRLSWTAMGSAIAGAVVAELRGAYLLMMLNAGCAALAWTVGDFWSRR